MKWVFNGICAVHQYPQDTPRDRPIIVFEERPDEKIIDLICAAPELLEGLRNIFALLDSGYLVRNIDNDHLPDFAMKQLKPMMQLKEASKAVERAEGRL